MQVSSDKHSEQKNCGTDATNRTIMPLSDPQITKSYLHFECRNLEARLPLPRLAAQAYAELETSLLHLTPPQRDLYLRALKALALSSLHTSLPLSP